jgi:riboflavin synthase
MFTGIVQGMARIIEIRCPAPAAQLKHFSLQFPLGALANIEVGASVALNGVCLTVTGFDADTDRADFDLMAETLTVTNLGRAEPGDQVNFERAATLGKEIGGHLMSGHVHTVVRLVRRVEAPGNVTLHFETPEALRKYLLPKGFVGLNGCSLTLGSLIDDTFCVHLIPETLSVTTFGNMCEGDSINLELDPSTQTIVDTVERYLASRDVGRSG